MSTILCILFSLVLGILGSVLNHELALNIPDLGAILSIVSAGGFIMYEVKKVKK